MTPILEKYDKMLEALTTSTQQLMQGQHNQGQEIKELKKQVGDVVNAINQLREPGKLLGGTIPNPSFEQAKAITTRSGKVVHDIPKKPKKVPMHVNEEEDVITMQKGQEKDPATLHEELKKPPSLTKAFNARGEPSDPSSLININSSSCLPFPSRFSQSRKEENEQAILDVFKKVHINIPLLDALKQVPKYAKFLKELCTTRRHIREKEVVKVGANVSAMIDRKIPPKCKDPGSFTIPCVIGNMRFENAMLDLGASINVMPYAVYTSLGLGELKKDNVVIQLANRSNAYPKGLLEDVLVQVDKLIFPADFYVLEMEDSPMNSASLLLGRPFMRTARTKIDVYAGTLTMEFDGEVIGFNIFEAMRYPLHEINSCFSVDIIDTLAQEFLKALKEDVLETTIEQGIGFTSHGIPISPKELKETFDDAVIETVAYLEALPRSERYTPPVPIQLSTNKILPSVIQAPSLELKLLPDHLKYVYLGDNETLPVIISSKLTAEQEEKLIT